MTESKLKVDLDERYTVNEFDCGCLIRSEFKGGAGQKWISYCRTHKDAPELVKALEAIKSLNLPQVSRELYAKHKANAAGTWREPTPDEALVFLMRKIEVLAEAALTAAKGGKG